MPSFQLGPMHGGAHVFVYGTLVDPRKLDEVVGHRHLGERLRARLHGYRRVVSSKYEYPFLVPMPDASVEGVLVMDLTAADMKSLDAYEEVADGVYERQAVEVEVWGCGPSSMYMRAYTYLGGALLRGLAHSTALAAS
jgi:gamma-glutamylcyclotransferase (GGCT)/AIG2-like uncharacterized protein YtfP